MQGKLRLAAALAAAVSAAPLLASAQAPAGPPAPNPAWKVGEVVAFTGVKPGDRVADIVGGRFTGALARAAGPTGKVYAVETAEVIKVHPEVMGKMQALAVAQPNVVVSADPVSTPLPPGLDVVFIRQNYHDLYDKFMGPADVAAFNRAVFAALKPGGVYVILDHSAARGAPRDVTETLHRIEEDRVKREVEAAGFVLEGESGVLSNTADPRTAGVFDASIAGHTDQFLLRFRRPT